MPPEAAARSLPIIGQPAPCTGATVCPISGSPCPGHCIFADILASISLGIVVFDLARDDILFCNRWARDLLERSGVPVDFAHLGALFLPPKRLRAGAVLQPEPLRIGTRFFGFTIYYAEAIAWVFLRDITQKARLEAIAEAVESTNNLGYVFSAVRHELGNPINSIKIALSVLQANLVSHSRETIAEYVDRMLAEIARVERLLRSLRSFSAYEKPQVGPVDLREFCADFIKLVEPMLSERDIRLDTHIDPGVTALCDARALHQVLLNVITNASDALAGRADARIEVRCGASDSVVGIQIEDNGVGVSPEQRAHLFKPFSTTKPNGTGLGLVISRKLLAAMNGTIAMESTEGRGTVVTISLPGADAPPSTRAAMESLP